jgi:hypothetical protein
MKTHPSKESSASMPVERIDTAYYTLSKHIGEGTTSTVPWNCLDYGQMAIIAEGDNTGELVVMTYSGLWSIESPSKFWSRTGTRFFKVRALRPTDAISLVVKPS